MTEASTFRKTYQAFYDNAVVDVSDYVLSGGPQKDFDRLKTTTFRTGGYRVTDGEMAGAAKSEFTIKYRYDPDLDRKFDTVIGNPSGFYFEDQYGNGAAPTQGDDRFYGTFTIFKRHYVGNAAGTAIEEVDIDYKLTDSMTGTPATWGKV